MIPKKENIKEVSNDKALEILLMAEEILERKITEFGSGSHVVLPKKHVGKRAKIIIEKN